MEMLQMVAILFIGIILPSVLLDMIGAPAKRGAIRDNAPGRSRNARWPFGPVHHREKEAEPDEKRRAEASGKA